MKVLFVIYVTSTLCVNCEAATWVK